MGEEKEILLHGKVCAYLTGPANDPNLNSLPFWISRHFLLMASI